MISIRAKIILFSELLFAAILCAFAFIIYTTIKHNEIVRLDSELEHYVSGFDRIISSSMADQNFPDTSDINELKAEGPKGIRYKFTDKNGLIKLGTLGADLPKKKVKGFFNATIDSKSYRCLFVELEPQQEKEYDLTAAAPLDHVFSTLSHLILFFAIVIPIFLLISGLASWVIIQVAFNPLQKIIGTAQNITANNLDCQIELPKARDEIYVLGKVFNEMIVRLGIAFKGQKQFVADASHEIRMPLAIIRSELEFAQRYDLAANVKESIALSLSEVDSLTNLAESLLTLTRFDAGRIALDLQPIFLKNFLSEIIKLMEGLAAQRAIAINLTGVESEIQGDWDLLKRAIVNVLDNAIKYSPREAIVKIATEIDSKRNTAVILIEDRGPGISAEDMSNIFKRFYRAESTRAYAEGHGLGLSIAEQIIKLHKGEISASSIQGKGAQFKITLPLSPTH